MITQHIADPFRGTQEFTINAGMERDGIGQRVCLHPDRTISQDVADLPTVIECDYCPTVALAAAGLRTELPAWYWTAP